MTWSRTSARPLASLAIVAFLMATSIAALHQAGHAEHVEADSCVACRVANHAPAVFTHVALAVEPPPHLPHQSYEPIFAPRAAARDALVARGPPTLPTVV